METKIKFSEVELPKGLGEKVFSAIEIAVHKEIIRRKIFGSIGIALSSFASFEFFFYLISEFKKSGFLYYASLLMSDYKIVASNFGTYVLSIVDSIPFFAVSMSVLSIFALMTSVRYIAGINAEFSHEKPLLA